MRPDRTKHVSTVTVKSPDRTKHVTTVEVKSPDRTKRIYLYIYLCLQLIYKEDNSSKFI